MMNEIIGRYVQVGSYRIHYESMGEGDPVIFLPTAGAAAGEYRMVLPLLAAHGYQGIAVEPPGHGSSYPDLEDLSLLVTADEYVDFVWEFIKTLNLKKPVVAGCAVSGSLMLLMGIKYGKNLTAVVAGAGNTELLIDPIQLNAVNHPAINTADMMESTTPGVCSKNVDINTLNECIWQNAKLPVPEVLYNELNIYNQLRLGPYIKLIKCPVLHIFGEEDTRTIDSEKQLIKKQCKNVTQVALPHTGHLIPVENPAGFTEAIINFLKMI